MCLKSSVHGSLLGSRLEEAIFKCCVVMKNEMSLIPLMKRHVFFPDQGIFPPSFKNKSAVCYLTRVDSMIIKVSERALASLGLWDGESIFKPRGDGLMCLCSVNRSERGLVSILSLPS